MVYRWLGVQWKLGIHFGQQWRFLREFSGVRHPAPATGYHMLEWQSIGEMKAVGHPHHLMTFALLKFLVSLGHSKWNFQKSNASIGKSANCPFGKKSTQWNDHMYKIPSGKKSHGKVFICKKKYYIIILFLQRMNVPRTILLHISMEKTAVKLIKNL